MLLSQHSGALLSQALVAAAAAVAQLLGAAEGVAVGGVLAELRPLQAVLLIETDVVQGLTVAVGGRRRFPACRRLRVKTTEAILTHTTPSLENTLPHSKLGPDSERSPERAAIRAVDMLTQGLHGCRRTSALVLRPKAVFFWKSFRKKTTEKKKKEIPMVTAGNQLPTSPAELVKG